LPCKALPKLETHLKSEGKKKSAARSPSSLFWGPRSVLLCAVRLPSGAPPSTPSSRKLNTEKKTSKKKKARTASLRWYSERVSLSRHVHANRCSDAPISSVVLTVGRALDSKSFHLMLLVSRVDQIRCFRCPRTRRACSHCWLVYSSCVAAVLRSRCCVPLLPPQYHHRPHGALLSLCRRKLSRLSRDLCQVSAQGLGSRG